MNPLTMVRQQETGAAAAPLGNVLVNLGKLRVEDLERVVHAQQQGRLRFGEAACALGLVSEADVRQALARQFDFPYLQPGEGALPIELVAAYQPWSPQVEVLRNVRSELLLRWFGAGHRSLAVAAIDSGDGASLFCANLALVFAQAGKHTLLVDANLRSPRQQEIFNLEAGMGLSDMLAGRAGGEALQEAGFSHLSVLIAGSVAPNPQELISHARLSAVEDALSARHDITLFDVPALSSSADALHVAARTGGILLLVRKDQTRLEPLQQAMRQLTRTGITVVGSVLLDF